MLNMSKKEDNIKVGARLRKYRLKLGLTCTDFANRLKRNRSYISGVENGHYPLSPKLVGLIERRFKVKAKWILSDVAYTDDSEYDDDSVGASYDFESNKNTEIPLIGETEAGLPSAILDDQLGSLISSEKSIAVNNLSSEDMFALKVRGYSMSPRVLPGDIVIVNATRAPENGKLCVAVTKNNESTLKIYEETKENIILRPLNPQNKVIILKKDEILRIYAVISILATSDYV